jgi:hypothetical protein
VNGRRNRAVLVAATVTAALIAGCGDEDSSDQPVTSAGAQAETAITTGKPGGSGKQAKKDEHGRRTGDGSGRPRDGVPSCAKAKGAEERKLACHPPEEAPPAEKAPPAEESPEAGEEAGTATAPEVARCVKQAGDDPEAKNECLPPQPEPEPAELSPEEQALLECAEAADTLEEKNACIED